MIRKKTWQAKLLIVIGLTAVVTAVVKYYAHHLSMSTALILVFVAGMVLMAIGIWSPPLSSFLGSRLPVIFILLLFFDNVLYWSSPCLEFNIVQMMSPQARQKYDFFHYREDRLMTQNGEVWYYKPDVSVKNPEHHNVLAADEFGYCNAPGYLAKIKESGLDVLLLGNSFIEHGSIPESLLKDLSPATVYTMGIGGQALPHYGFQFDRWTRSSFFTPPRVVVVNFYGGSDVSMTLNYLKNPEIPSWITDQNVQPLWPQRKLSFFTEIKSILMYMWTYRLAPSAVQYDETMGQEESVKIFFVLSGIVNKIRHAAPHAKILLSYIATPGAIYGSNERYCIKVTHEIFPKSNPYDEACREDSAKQAATSSLLAQWSKAIGIDYIDPTPQLRRAGEHEVLHYIDNPHLNDVGGRIYAQAVAGKIREMLRQKMGR